MHVLTILKTSKHLTVVAAAKKSAGPFQASEKDKGKGIKQKNGKDVLVVGRSAVFVAVRKEKRRPRDSDPT